MRTGSGFLGIYSSAAERGLLAAVMALLLSLGKDPAALARQPDRTEELAAVTVQLESLPQARSFQVWSMDLALLDTEEIRDYRLLDGVLYAMGNNGVVRAMRATDGHLLWTRALTGRNELLRPPTSQSGRFGRSIVFTIAEEVLMLDPLTGLEHRSVRLREPSVAPAIVSDRLVFLPTTSGRIRTYTIKNGVPGFSLSLPNTIELAPVFLSQEALIVFAGSGGLLGAASTVVSEARPVALQGKDRQTFGYDLGGQPQGWLTVDEGIIYASTERQRMHAVDLSTGENRWVYRLAGWPEGGPVVTETSIYQSIAGGGLHRIGKLRDTPNWHHPLMKEFLAEWKQGPACLAVDGTIVVMDKTSGEPAYRVAHHPDMVGLSNPHNDAVFLASKRGIIRCLQPGDAEPLTMADFDAGMVREREGSETGNADTGTDEADEAESTDAAAAEQTVEGLELTIDELNDPLKADR